MLIFFWCACKNFMGHTYSWTKTLSVELCDKEWLLIMMQLTVTSG